MRFIALNLGVMLCFLAFYKAQENIDFHDAEVSYILYSTGNLDLYSDNKANPTLLAISKYMKLDEGKAIPY